MFRLSSPAILFALYFCIPAIFFQLAVVLAKRSSAIEIFREGGLAETVQLICTILTGVILFVLSRRHATHAGGLALMAATCLMAAIRELNNTQLYQTIFAHGGAAWIFGAVVLGSVVVIYRRVLIRQLFQLAGQRAAAVFAAAFVIIVVWAQVLAQKSIFPDRTIDRIVEEALETAGYLLLLCGAIDLCFNLHSQRPIESPSQPEDKRAKPERFRSGDTNFTN